MKCIPFTLLLDESFSITLITYRSHQLNKYFNYLILTLRCCGRKLICISRELQFIMSRIMTFNRCRRIIITGCPAVITPHLYHFPVPPERLRPYEMKGKGFFFPSNRWLESYTLRTKLLGKIRILMYNGGIMMKLRIQAVQLQRIP